VVLTNLGKELLKWQEEGDSIILLTDFNEDVRLLWIHKFFANVDLVKVLTKLTGPIATVMHNHGQLPIDGICISPQLIPAITGGYLAFEAGI